MLSTILMIITVIAFVVAVQTNSEKVGMVSIALGVGLFIATLTCGVLGL